VCFGTKGIVLSKSHNVEIVQDAVCLIAGSVFNTGGKENGGVVGKKGYINSSSCNLIHILHFVG